MREINGPNSARCPRFRAARWAPFDTSLILFSKNMSVIGATISLLSNVSQIALLVNDSEIMSLALWHV